MDELNALVGLAEVKTKIHEIATFLERRGKERLPCIHMVFRGNPGTGKTLVARLLGRIFADLGITRSGDTFIETDREGLVAGYVGQTAIKTADRIREAMGGVLFIDEAYLLNMNSGNDFGHECIATLTKRMEDCRNDFICIMAGYAAQMDKMLNLNPGLRERVQFYIDFPDYSAAELLQIFKDLCGTNRYTLERTAENLLSEQLAKVIAGKDENFSNARIVRKLFERVQIQQALRTTDMEIQAADISLAFRSSDIVPLVEGRGASRIGFAG
jgi:SpoVK/Ycf46/Vps4 family AAA+-type ATPase